ncbi:transcription antitermination factor NusB [Mobilicoccus sp.]|uniref:transcription antitermination factor NusB n=1 Tax=Mobilicoccus sp. TaxID=2034349 RepID=UPI002897AB25|nr:transcription antitermination factor NusB [Mobilicoccus sp.]
MTDRLEFSSAPVPDPAREPRDAADPSTPSAGRGIDELAFREAQAREAQAEAEPGSGAAEAAGAPEGDPGREVEAPHEDDLRDAEPDEDEEWSSGPLPVPSSLPEGAVLSEETPRRGERGRLTSARSKARKAAVELLYEAEQRGMNAGTLLDERVARPTTQTPLREYTVECVRGVVEHWVEIGETLETYSRGWRLSRMPAVDRAILRVGTWEILHNDDVPGGVAVSEAVVIAQVLSTDDSPSFVNGLLSRIEETA